jgi:hypothetical protein
MPFLFKILSMSTAWLVLGLGAARAQSISSSVVSSMGTVVSAAGGIDATVGQAAATWVPQLSQGFQQVAIDVVPEPSPPLGINIYPNPVIDRITLQSDVGVCQLHLYNALGQQVASLSLADQGTLSLTGLTRGTYLLRVRPLQVPVPYPIAISTQTFKLIKR